MGRGRGFEVQPPVLAALLASWILYSLSLGGCDSSTAPDPAPEFSSESLSTADVDSIVAHAVEQATRVGQTVVIAVTDRPGNILRIFSMTGTGEAGTYDPANPGATPLSQSAVAKARTAAFLSSNQHAFSTLTACFITRKHFPPIQPNTPGGPLFGVPNSNLPGTLADVSRTGLVQPNGSGLSGAPGGVPLFKNGALVGGIGVHGSDDAASFTLDLCAGDLDDERIALGGALGFAVNDDERGDLIFIDGIRFLFTNAATPPGDFTLSYAGALGLGSEIPETGGSLNVQFPDEGPVILQTSAGPIDFSPIGGSNLTVTEVEGILLRAAGQANRTRAAIRRPIGVPARVFVSVVDVDGTVLGIHRTPEATFFSYDVCVQKARTALAFSQPTHPLGQRLRALLGLAATDPLAVSTRAAGFLAQDFFPPGIDEETLEREVVPGPLFGVQDSLTAVAGYPPYGNGITIFPGGFPLYRGDVLVGAIGISGDGVDQDDLIGFTGATGFQPPDAIRADRFSYDGVRLPYVKFPRNPEIE